MSEPRDERAEHEHRGAHLFDEFVRSDGIFEFSRLNFDAQPMVFMFDG